MRVILFGATGMVGQGVLRECVRDAGVSEVLSVVRKAGATPARVGDTDVAACGKVRELLARDFFDFSGVESEFAGFDACLFAIGVSTFAVKAEEYPKITRDIPVAVARSLVRANPAMKMVFVSAHGADETEQSGAMWKRVKGETENAMLRAGFASAHVLRPLGIVPMHGIQSRTRLYRGFYGMIRPLLPALLRGLPKYVTSTEGLGQAMIAVARGGYANQRLEAADISAVAAGASAVVGAAER
jgi:uncharacterized protein YbjT (DUF2867 family)